MNIIDGNPRVFVKPDVPQAIAFLKDYAPTGPWVLTGIAEGQGAPTASFMPDQVSDLGRWILQLQSENRNVYFLAGDPKGPLTKKAVKADMARARYLWADLDARRDLDWRDAGAAAAEMEALYRRLAVFRLPPSVMVASGGGFQAFWKLSEPFELVGDAVKIARFEAVNKALAEALDADHCHNADRIMRLPGTVNYPNARKRGLGRVPAPASLVLFKAELVYPIEAFSAPEPKQTPAAAISGALTGLPPWLQKKLHAAPPQGDRSGAFFAAACALFQHGLSDSQVIAAFAAVPNGVAAKFARRGDLAAEVGRCRAKWRPACVQKPSAAVIPAACEPLPLMREAAKPAPFPIGALGPALAPVAKAIARAAQVPDALAGQSVLAAAALAVQGLADVETPYGACKPISLFLMTIAGSGDRKSTTDRLALRGVRAFEEAAIARYQAARKTYRRAMRDYEASLKHTGKDGGYQPEEPAKPFTPHMIFEDITAQSLVKRLESNQPSIGLFSSEGGKLTGGYAMSDKGKTHSAGVFNTLWDDGSADRWRSGEEDGVRLRGRRLSAHIMLQPGVASEFLADRSLADQGFLARWLVTAPESMMGCRPWQDRCPEDDAIIGDFAGRLKELAALDTRRVLDENGQPGNVLEPLPLKLSMDACDEWIGFYNEVEAGLASGAGLRPIAGFAAKLAEQALRLAGVLTIAERSAAGAIGAGAMVNAIELSRHYLGEALRLHGAELVAADLTEAAALLERLMAKWPDQPFSIREILALNISFIATSRKARALLNGLMEHGLLTMEVVPTRTKPGERWRIVSEGGG